MQRAEEILAQIREMSIRILGENLTGLYVHGSLAFGCFHWETGDIDYLAVVKEPLSLDEKMEYIRALLDIDENGPDKGIEMSVVRETDCRNFRHPVWYELHFSRSHLDCIRADLRAYCERMQGADPDLAAHFAVTRAVGRTLFGPNCRDMFAPVPREAYLDSIRLDVQNGKTEILKAPVYVTLNLCRGLAFWQEERILSKAQGGQWGLAHVPKCYHEIIRAALGCYKTGADFPMTENGDMLMEWAEYMLARMA